MIEEPTRPVGETLRDLDTQLAIADLRSAAREARKAALLCYIAFVLVALLGGILAWGVLA